MQKTLRTALVASGVTMTSFAVNAQDVKLSFHDLRSESGNILVGFFNQSDDFDNFENEKAFISVKAKDAGKGYVVRGLPEGTYAILAVHDENSNDDLDMDATGIPKEGYTYSKNARKDYELTFKAASFQVTENKPVEQPLHFLYIQ